VRARDPGARERGDIDRIVEGVAPDIEQEVAYVHTFRGSLIVLGDVLHPQGGLEAAGLST
jgi:hypothetical protein